MAVNNVYKIVNNGQGYTDGGWKSGQNAGNTNTTYNNLTNQGYPSSTGGYGNNGYIQTTPYTTNQTRPYSSPNYQYSATSPTGTQNYASGNTAYQNALDNYSQIIADSQNYDGYGNYIGGGSTGGSSGGGSSDGGTVVAPTGSDAYFQQLLKLYNAQKSQNQSAYDAALKNAQQTQKNTTASAQKAYNRALNSLKSTYSAQKSSVNANNKKTVNDLNTTANNDLQQAYINSMLAQRGLEQSLNAQGYNGGVSETTRANMANAYGNNRNAINTNLEDNLANQALAYQQALSDLQTNFNSNKSNLASNLQTATDNAQNAYNQALYNAQQTQSNSNNALYNQLLSDMYNRINTDTENSQALSDALDKWLKEQNKSTKKTTDKKTEKKKNASEKDDINLGELYVPEKNLDVIEQGVSAKKKKSN